MNIHSITPNNNNIYTTGGIGYGGVGGIGYEGFGAHGYRGIGGRGYLGIGGRGYRGECGYISVKESSNVRGYTATKDYTGGGIGYGGGLGYGGNKGYGGGYGYGGGKGYTRDVDKKTRRKKSKDGYAGAIIGKKGTSILKLLTFNRDSTTKYTNYNQLSGGAIFIK